MHLLMDKQLFKTKEDQESAVAHFRALLETPGWKLLEEIIDSDVERVKDEILKGVENETLDVINRLRDRLTALQKVKNIPSNLIEKFTVKESFEPELDPYSKVDTETFTK